jgi:peptidoglycan/xylan/chitin deacetylase (PgdA/CDA1 family)
MIRAIRLRPTGALLVAILFVAVACGGSTRGASKLVTTLSAHGGAPATTSVGGSTTGMGSGPTVGPGSPGSAPTAASLPVVNSCNPKSVPTAIPVKVDAVGVSSLALHVPILMYHRIVPPADAGHSLKGLVVPPETFAAQMNALAAAGWHTITMATLASDLEAGVKPPAKTFVVTIDDGWDDGYTYALPILQRHGFVATYFVIAGRIDVPGFLSSAHLRALVAAGNEIGDHTMTHFNLVNGSTSERQFQVDAAAARIAQVVGRWPESLAYPFGGENSQALAAVAGCEELRTAVIESSSTPAPQAPIGRQTTRTGTKPALNLAPRPTTTPGPGQTPIPSETWANRFTIQRMRVSPDTTPADLLGEFALYLRAG